MTTRTKAIIGTCMVLSALWLATTGRAVVDGYAPPVERPFRIHGEATVLIDWEQAGADAEGRLFVPWTMTASQLSTEGWSTNEGAGVIYLDTFDAEGSGSSTELNGDSLAWDSVEVFGTQRVTVTFTGGTGQFEGVTGEFALDYTVLDMETNEDGNPLWMTYTFWGAGSITD